MKKRGELSALNKLILGVVVGFILIFASYFILFPMLFAESDREACRISVEAKSRTKIFQDSPIVSDIICKTQYVEVTDKAIKKNDKIIAALGKNPEQKVKKTIADEMYDCWYQMGEGKLDPWGDWGVKQNHCIICSEITFSDKAKQKFGTLKELNKFLCDTTIPGSTKTYCTYFKGKNEFEPVDIDTKEPHAIVYIIEDQTNLGTLGGYTGGGCGVGAAGSAAVGSVFFGFGAVPGAIVGGIGGCIGGFVSGIFEATLGEAQIKNLRAGMFIVPQKQIEKINCDLLY